MGGLVLGRRAARGPTVSRATLEAFLGGLALGLLFLPHPWAFLAPLPLALVFARVAGAPTPRAAFGAGFAGGLGFFAVHLAWLPISFADLLGPAGAAPMPLAVLGLALMWGLAAGLARWAAGPRTLAALPFAWAVLEFLRGLGPLGFTWGSLGYALLPTPAIQVADLGGVGLAGLLVSGTAAALAAAARGAWRPLALAGGLLAAAVAYGLTRPAPPAPDREVLLVQGSVNPLEKARGRSGSELDLYEGLSRRGLGSGPRPDLIVWPEGASPRAPTEPAVAARLEALGAPLLVGAPTWYGAEYRNSAYGFSGGVTGRYDKVKLVPFGELFPLRGPLAFVYDLVFAAMGLPPLLGAAPGDGYRPLPLGPVRAGAYICYESTFPAVSRALVRAGANLLVNVSNDAWFGRTAGAEQHFQMGRLRAIETRRYLARAGNDGITAVIDPLGRVLERFPRGERAAYRARVALGDALTPYVRLGDWPVAVSAVVLVLIALGRPRAS